MKKGYFVDWDGNTRPVSNPGVGLRCELTERCDYTRVSVIAEEDCEVVFECVYHKSIEDIEKLGVAVNLLNSDKGCE